MSILDTTIPWGLAWRYDSTPSGGRAGLPCEETGAVGAFVMDAAWSAGHIVEQGGKN